MINIFNNKNIFVTGGTGSFGYNFICEILKNFNPEKIVIFSRDEVKQFDMSRKLNKFSQKIKFILGDIRDKSRLIESMKGADYVLNHHDNEDLIKQINDISANKGCDVIFEHVGSNTWPNTMKSLGIGGRVVTCGATTGANISIDLRHLFMKQQTIMGSTMSDIKSFKQVMKNINKKLYKPFVDKVFIFNEIKEAHSYMENRHQMGKIVLVP